MANEAKIVQLLGNGGDVQTYTVADGTGIAKGAIMAISGDSTMIAASTNGQSIAGIAVSEKVASDGSTLLGVYTNGIFDLTCNAGAAVTLGEMVAVSGANLIRDALEADFPNGAVIGKALEAGSTSEVIKVRVLI